MDEEDAITLLLKAAHQPGLDDYKDPNRWMLARSIVSALGCLALAFTQAGATIQRRLQTLETYLQVYEKEMIMTKLLPPTRSNSEGKEKEKERCIRITYEISFNDTKESQDLASIDAIEILHIFAFLHFQQIPEAIFRHAWNNLQLLRIPSPIESDRKLALWPKQAHWDGQQENLVKTRLPGILLQSTWDDRRLHDALAVLNELSFIYYDDAKQMCWMHPMVHLWARNHLELEDQKYWLETTITLVAYSISPNLEPSGRDYRCILIPHFANCLQVWQSNARSGVHGIDTVRASASDRFAAVYAEVGDWGKARELYVKVHSFLQIHTDQTL